MLESQIIQGRRIESPLDLGPELFELLPPDPITAPLSSLQPLLIEMVGRKDPGYRLFQRTLCQHYYLGYRGPVGESIGYLWRHQMDSGR